MVRVETSGYSRPFTGHRCFLGPAHEPVEGAQHLLMSIAPWPMTGHSMSASLRVCPRPRLAGSGLRARRAPGRRVSIHRLEAHAGRAVPVRGSSTASAPASGRCARAAGSPLPDARSTGTADRASRAPRPRPAPRGAERSQRQRLPGQDRARLERRLVLLRPRLPRTPVPEGQPERDGPVDASVGATRSGVRRRGPGARAGRVACACIPSILRTGTCPGSAPGRGRAVGPGTVGRARR